MSLQECFPHILMSCLFVVVLLWLFLTIWMCFVVSVYPPHNRTIVLIKAAITNFSEACPPMLFFQVRLARFLVRIIFLFWKQGRSYYMDWIMMVCCLKFYRTELFFTFLRTAFTWLPLVEGDQRSECSCGFSECSVSKSCSKKQQCRFRKKLQCCQGAPDIV